ncbi:sensor histidine kinase [Bacillus sp. V5-8f]|uniref:sensor histidine kinase n=1 Tax=Bacillus sp. V5-8f TaxID=2053044 RepID=UPI000C757723|nr:sensor histidine kinase [Bacillus sp. V5-8f]PLT35971.1 sensor histidine kinase [Bacillus sp. V5-8f]
MIHLLPLMLERVGVILIAAFLLSQIKSFRRIIHHDEQRIIEKTLLIAVFGMIGVISNYTGIEIRQNSVSENAWLIQIEPDSAIANTRIMGIAIGSILGGPLVGFGIGLIAGAHRYMLGGFTAAACAISAVLAGIAAGYFGKRRKKKAPISAGFAVMTGVLMEIIQMMIILLLTKPFPLAWDLVKVIGLPMILINGFGTLLFMLIIQSILREEERTRALQTNLAFHIADRTLPYFRQGLNPESCKQVADIMHNLTHADAISITDENRVLAHVGAASDHHIPLQGFATGLTKKVLKQGRVITAKSKEEIVCYQSSCPLRAAVVLPLKVHQNTVGTLKLYFEKPDDLNEVEKELAEGLAKLFSTQLELAEAENQSKLLKDAEIKALQAQVHPHFLFNAINTISVLCRTDAEKARKLLLELSYFFRSNIQGARHTLIPLEKELEHVQAYLSLEQARFPDKYHITFEIQPGLEGKLLPPFTLQPLVENAICHGFPQAKSKGEVNIAVYQEDQYMCICVKDNGKGISPKQFDSLGKQAVYSMHGTGTALVNIRERLEGIYNGNALFKIKSTEGSGTEVTVTIPIDRKGVNEDHVAGIFSR